MRMNVRFAVITCLMCLTGLDASRYVVSPVNAYEQRSDQKTPARRALLIGIGKYDTPQFPYLEYPANDVARMSELLESSSYGFKVTKLTDDTEQKPTRANILAAMQKYLVDDPQPGDTVLFYYSGHGSWVANSLSDESDKRDETIVPNDAVRPVTRREDLKDIRDKEIVDIFNRALEKKVKLTAIFDSCHSGSIARGDEPSKEVDGVQFDIHEAPTRAQRIKPEEHGALVLTASEDYQQASGGRYELNGHNAKYSHLTADLLQSLYEVPAERQSARELFRAVAARMVSDGRTQTPTIAGKGRLDETLFGQPTAASTGRARVRVTSIDENGIKRLLLGGGLADGLEDGDELQRIDAASNKPTDPPVKVRITKAALTVSQYEIVQTPVLNASAANVTINTNDLFVQTTWASKKEPTLSVWIEPAVFAEKDLKVLARSVQKSGSQAEFIPEPTSTEPHSIVFAEVAAGKPQWEIRLASGAVAPVGSELTSAAEFQKASQNSTAKTKVFLDVPPSMEMRAALEASLRSGDGGVVLTSNRDSAQYELIGHYDAAADKIEYAWALRSKLQAAKQAVGGTNKDAPTLSLPPLTDWTDASQREFAAGQLKLMAMKLGKLRAWLRMTSPIKVGGAEFPYHLEIRDRSAARRTLSTGDVLFAMDKGDPASEIDPKRQYDLVLKGDPSLLKTSSKIMPEFWAYVIDIDVNGNASQILQADTNPHNAGMNNFDALNPPDQIWLGAKDKNDFVKISCPCGTETFVLLVTDRAITDPGLLNFAGVRGIEEINRGEEPKPIETLLSHLGVSTTARGEYSTPDTWAIQRLVFTSVDTAAKTP